MLNRIWPAINDGRYTLRPEGSGLRVVWNLDKHSVANRLTYIHGRDYGEIFRSHNLFIPGNTTYVSGLEASATRVAFLAISRSATTQNARSRFFVDLSRPPRFVNPNETIEKLLIDPIAGKQALAFGTDHFISTISNIAPELIRHNKGEFSAFIERIRGTMVGDHTLLSLDGIEGSLAAAAIIACANQERTKVRIILGPSKYRLLASGKQVPRPMVRESRVISVYSRATGASEPDAGRHFDEWSYLPVNPTVIKSGRTRGRYLTQEDINNFVSWQPDVDELDEIPAPVAGEMQFAVADGKIVALDKQISNATQISSLKVGARHLINLIEDVFESAHLGNWAPGAKRKLDRLLEGLRQLEASPAPTEHDATLIALDGEAFRHVYRASEEELSDAARAEFSPLFVQMDLVFSQMQSWKDFKQFGASIGWGTSFTDEYREALQDVASGIGDFPDSLATNDVRSAMNDAAKKITSPQVTDQVAATARIQNVLSIMFRYMKSFGSKTAAKTGEKIQEAAADGASHALQQATWVLKGRLIDLATSNPTLFGWMMNFLRG